MKMYLSVEDAMKWRDACTTDELIPILGVNYKIESISCEIKHKNFAMVEVNLVKSHNYTKEIVMKQNVPHKHAAVIHAFADGLTVQYRDSQFSKWHDITFGVPVTWYEHFEYRVKPLCKTPLCNLPANMCPSHANLEFSESILSHFVSSGELAKYVEKYGVDGLKGQ